MARRLTAARRMWKAGALALGLGAGAWVRPVRAQQAGLEASYGRWWPDSTWTLYQVGYYRALLGPLSWGLGVVHLEDNETPPTGTQTGPELSVALGRGSGGFYALGTAGLGLRHQDGKLEGWWSAGFGWMASLLPVLSVGIEARYRAEDQQLDGAWRLLPSDRRGLSAALRLAIGRPTRKTGPAALGTEPGFRPPSEGDLARMARERGASDRAARVAAAVVQSALEVMGTPYTWGGSDENGYDCSGLIQYAYGQHGIILPRVSRDQVRMGRPVERNPSALQPGDILGFSVEGNRVTHVGLYLGEGRFIHSASGGVRISSLVGDDPDGDWWRRHWVLARRILQE